MARLLAAGTFSQTMAGTTFVKFHSFFFISNNSLKSAKGPNPTHEV